MSVFAVRIIASPCSDSIAERVRCRFRRGDSPSDRVPRGTTSDLLREERRRLLAEAITSLERALEVGPPYGHYEDQKMSRGDIELRLTEWRLELEQI